jgi:ABC-type glycerol-3-phosphate transport system substrate-binding protein
VTGSEDEFIYGVDAFALCKDAPDEQNAKNFLKAIGSPEAQAAFNIIKGSSPVNPNVDTSEWNSLAKATLEQLKNATVLHNVEINQFSVPGATAKDAATGIADQLLNLYTGDITKDEFISWIVDNYKAATSGE